MSTTITTGVIVETDAPVLLAASYLRVSTREQAERGGTDEGFSIPAQREANARKADELGAKVVREFIDAGESAKVGGSRRAQGHALVHHRHQGDVLHRVQARPARSQPFR